MLKLKLSIFSTKTTPNLKVFLGSASYRLPFVVAPEVADFEHLKGRVIAVDALNTGFAFLLREMLEINGLAMIVMNSDLLALQSSDGRPYKVVTPWVHYSMRTLRLSRIRRTVLP